MKVHFLPELQRQRNDQILKRLRRFAVLLWVLLLACVSAAASLYIRGPVIPLAPQMVAQDTGIAICDAAVISPEYVLCAGDGPVQADLIVGSSRVAAARVKTATLAAGLTVTLYRLNGSTAVETLVPTVVDGSEPLVAQTNGVVWQGTGTPTDSGTLKPVPELTIPPGIPVLLLTDRSAIVGLTAPGGSGGAIVSMARVLESFPEASGAAK